jgi:uncharacterized membrane protein YdjX (TVP38/TMEM64 family)
MDTICHKENKHLKKTILALSVIAAILTIILLFDIIIKYGLFNFSNLNQDASKLTEFIRSFGIFSGIIFILIQIIQVLIFFIPGEVTGFVGGYLFGAFWGTVYTILGVVLGSLFAFWLARKFGRPFVKRIVGQKYLDRLDSFSEAKITLIFFIIFLLPLFPDDIFCFLAGLTKMKTRIFFIIVSIGRFPGYLMLSILGGGLATSQVNLIIIFSVVCIIILGIVFLFKKNIEHFLEIK